MTSDQQLPKQLNNSTNDTYKFHCRKCCKHKDKVILTARDVYNISEELSISIKELIEKYCSVYTGSNTPITIVKIHPRRNMWHCPFLKNNKCLIYNIETYTVKDWLKHFDNDEFLRLWTDIIQKVERSFMKLTDEHISSIYKFMYWNYEINSSDSFLTQFKKNKEIIEEIINNV